jgi:hypothetical protein
LMAEMNSGFEQLPHRDDGHGDAPSFGYAGLVPPASSAPQPGCPGPKLWARQRRWSV